MKAINCFLLLIIASSYINNYKYGDWGLGIGDWAIPNPQSPIPNPLINL